VEGALASALILVPASFLLNNCDGFGCATVRHAISDNTVSLIHYTLFINELRRRWLSLPAKPEMNANVAVVYGTLPMPCGA
jgi:hypothetical protein